jgi:predicted RNase H-like HicB family nuclease
LYSLEEEKNNVMANFQRYKTIIASIPVYFFKLNDKDKFIFAECPALGIITNGNSLREAKKMFEEAFSLWIETVEEKFNLVDALKSLGWKITSNEIFPENHMWKVPCTLLASQPKNISIQLPA